MESKDLSDVLKPLALGAQVAGGVTQAGAAYAKGVADRTAYNIQADVTDNNAAIARAQSGDAIRRGQTAMNNAQLRTRQLKGQQIATMAANGVDLGSGSPLEILTSTDLMGENDVGVIARNAAKEAWGFDVAASNAATNADLLRRRAGMEMPVLSASSSLLTSAGQVASRWFSTRHPLADY